MRSYSSVENLEKIIEMFDWGVAEASKQLSVVPIEISKETAEVPDFNRHLELIRLKREILELKVAWKTEQEESKIVRRRILELAKQVGENNE